MEYRIEMDATHKKNSYGIHSPVYGGYFDYSFTKIDRENLYSKKNTKKNNKRKKKVKEKSGDRRKVHFDNIIPEINVYSGYLNFNYNDTEDVILYLPDISNNNVYKVLGTYNIKSGKYYVSYEQVKKHIKGKHHIRAKFHCYGNSVFENFREFSELKLYGYSVGCNGETEFVRHRILRYVIDNKVMTGTEIISHLQGQISLREYRTDKDFSAAISDWKRDIGYVQTYMMKTRKLRKVRVA